MSVEIIPVTGIDLIPQRFTRRWTFGNQPLEKYNTTRAANWAKKNQARCNLLSINGDDVGFFILDIHQFPEFPKEKQYYIQVLYFFVSHPYRGDTPIPELDGATAPWFMMVQVISRAMEIATLLPVRELILQPASEKLVPLYKGLGFEFIPRLPKFMSVTLTGS